MRLLPPLRRASHDTSPPEGGEDGSQAGRPSSPSRSGGEVASPKGETERGYTEPRRRGSFSLVQWHDDVTPPALIIFDCDGVLVDSEPISIAVLLDVLASAGHVMSEETAYELFLGRS